MGEYKLVGYLETPDNENVGPSEYPYGMSSGMNVWTLLKGESSPFLVFDGRSWVTGNFRLSFAFEDNNGVSCRPPEWLDHRILQNGVYRVTEYWYNNGCENIYERFVEKSEEPARLQFRSLYEFQK